LSVEIVELRQYQLKPGQREVLVALFEESFVEAQEEWGCRLIGQFRDLDRPDRFVWLRGFADMATRLSMLTNFYGGAGWKARAAEANETMIDSDNVLLLRPAGVTFPPDDGSRPPAGSTAESEALIAVTVFPLPSAEAEVEFLDFLRGEAAAVTAQPERRVVAELRTAPEVNDFPGLPVREGEHNVVSVVAFESVAAHAAYRRRLQESPEWTDKVRPALAARLAGEPERLRLTPTPRSWLR
jgi:hypothetical protein